MITQVSIKIADYFLKNEIISEDLKLIYQLGFDVLISTFTQFVSIIGIGFLLGDPVGALLFLCCFMTIRAYSGGFHAKTRNQCMLIMIFSYYFSNVIEKFLAYFLQSIVAFLMVFLGVFVVIIFLKFAPIKNDRKILPQNWRVNYRRNLFVVSVFWDLAIVFLIRNYRHFSVILLMSQVTAAVLILLSVYECGSKQDIGVPGRTMGQYIDLS